MGLSAETTSKFRKVYVSPRTGPLYGFRVRAATDCPPVVGLFLGVDETVLAPGVLEYVFPCDADGLPPGTALPPSVAVEPTASSIAMIAPLCAKIGAPTNRIVSSILSQIFIAIPPFELGRCQPTLFAGIQ